MALNDGDTLLNDQYRILRLLGRGGFGFVYQAQDTLLHKEVAIKELIPGLVGEDAWSGDQVTRKRFLVEARATMELAHDRIVRTYNVFQEGGNYYTVMECMAGGSLGDRLREKGSLSIDEAVRIASEVCEGLGYAHQRGIVHCDLKPANILFTNDGKAKVADFGIAHVSEQMLTRSWMTSAGYVAGTLPYMSPEQADGVRDDPRIDIYALGAVLYRMLTGRTYVEFEQRDTPGAWVDNVLRIRGEEPEPPSAHNRRVPGWLDDVVLKALSKSADERYSSSAEMQAALAAEGKVEPVRLAAAAERAQAHSRLRWYSQRSWFWPVLAGAAVVLLAIVTSLVLLLPGREGAPEAPSSLPTEAAMAVATSTPTPSRSSLPPAGAPAPTDTAVPTLAPTSTPTPTPTDTDLPPTATHTPASTPTQSSTPTPTRSRTPTPTRTRSPTPTRTSTPTPTRRPTVTPAVERATPTVAQPTAAPTTQTSVATLSLLNAEIEDSGSFAGDCIVTGRWDPEDAGITDGNLEVYTSDGTLLRVVPDAPKYPWAANFMHFNLSFLPPGEYYAKITWYDPVHGFITAVPPTWPDVTNIIQVVITESDCWSKYQ